MNILQSALTILGQNADLIADIIEALAAGAPKEALRAAIRKVKREASDAAFREELGLPPE
jgi:hypothetical protein